MDISHKKYVSSILDVAQCSAYFTISLEFIEKIIMEV